MALRQLLGKRFFCPKQHLWYRTIPKDPQKVAIQIGFTETGIHQLGDVTAVLRLVSRTDNGNNGDSSAIGSTVRVGDSLVQVNWEAYTQTSADELYHTVWDNAEGQETICSPVAGVVSNHASADIDSGQPFVDEDTILAEVWCEADDLSRASAEWMSKNQYEQFIEDLAEGRFAD